MRFLSIVVNLLIFGVSAFSPIKIYSKASNNFILEGNEIDTKEKIVKPSDLDIYFYGPVTDDTCLQLTTALKQMDKISKRNHFELGNGSLAPISLHIQSNGGMLMPSFYVCDVIQNLDTPVHTYIDGYAASAASLISVCGKKRYTTRFSNMLIHQLSTRHSGKAIELEDGMKNVDLLMENIRKIYLENSKLNESKLNELLLHDLWLSSYQCLEYGLVDEVL